MVFGLFDRPSLKIAKHVPDWARETVVNCECVIGNEALNFGFNKTEFELAKGFALAVWVLNEQHQGRLALSNYQGRYIGNTGTNCLNMLRTKSDLAIALVNHLEKKGVIEAE
ncbi:hypothetical protein [Erythrobacter litoralis]|uniref:Uncharacterized protein n=1 Tax=Erythrobacter litoralis (strain HTCC2594) TaxID=314225 RepID=Q2N910_ERYLH|nr:hypothetical protein [Erythrobacter litoralis]ABC63831.1 hypothetical protein ELI_08695 [Erythrobacter litoralis HTCC2594]